MNCRNSQFKQRGVFSVEFALIAVFFSVLLVFSGDVIIKLSTKGKLDRLSYSLVSIIKERSKLYPVDSTLTQAEIEAEADTNTDAEVDDIYLIASRSLARTMGSFEPASLGMRVEQITYNPDRQIEDVRGTGCNVNQPLNALLTPLGVVTSWGRNVGLYRVTLCYQTDNWFGNLVGQRYTTVSSSSVITGR
jgi:tight adherence protein F